MKRRILKLLMLVLLFELCAVTAMAQEIVDIRVKGNVKVETDAILTILKTQKGTKLNKATIRDDIKQLYGLGYFSDIKIFEETTAGGVNLVVDVVEKPAIMEIQFNGMKQISQDDVKDKIETKLYTIVNDATIMKDMRLIEKQYLEKGFYLAQASYQLKPRDEKNHEVTLVFNVEEGGVVHIGTMNFLGNKYFSDSQVVEKFMSKPLTRASAFSGAGSVYNDEFLNRDMEVLQFLYKDQGFAEVNVANPSVIIDKNREFVRISIELEEGIQYSVGGIEITGDLLFPDAELKDAMKLKLNKLFRYSQFRQDVEKLTDKYGDKGYAFVDVNPIPKFDREKKLVYLDYHITKGEKVYFGNMNISGNTKTRDNVIRREFEVADAGLYSGTGITNSKNNSERLGFFEQGMQAIRSRNTTDQNLLDYDFRVKEKPTGQLQAALGYSPSATAENSFFGQGRYNEENQSGRGWKSNVTARWNGGKNYSFDLGMTDPRVNDSYWSLGFAAFFRNEILNISDGLTVQEKTTGASTTVGRKIWELVYGSVTYKIAKITQDSDTFLLQRFKEGGIASSLIFGLSRNSTNNYMDPSEGTILKASQGFTGGPILSGTQQYMQTSASATDYYPIDFTDTYRTYFRFYGGVDLLNVYGNKPIPFFQRFRLGGPMDLRGYDLSTVGPEYNIYQAPGDYPRSINNGGTKQLLFQAEYFVPIIPEANIKGVLFADLGRVFAEEEALSLSTSTMKKDVGFGFRWITPIAPFRFEWAYPYDNGKVGKVQFVFFLGY